MTTLASRPTPTPDPSPQGGGETAGGVGSLISYPSLGLQAHSVPKFRVKAAFRLPSPLRGGVGGGGQFAPAIKSNGRYL